MQALRQRYGKAGLVDAEGDHASPRISGKSTSIAASPIRTHLCAHAAEPHAHLSTATGSPGRCHHTKETGAVAKVCTPRSDASFEVDRKFIAASILRQQSGAGVGRLMKRNLSIL